MYKELFNLSEEGASIPGAPLEETKEPLEYVRLAQDLWQMKLRNAVIRLCSETKAMLAKPVRSGLLTDRDDFPYLLSTSFQYLVLNLAYCKWNMLYYSILHILTIVFPDTHNVEYLPIFHGSYPRYA